MNDIKNVFLTKTISDLLSKEFNMPEIKFVFDETTLNSFEDFLDKNDSNSYNKGISSIDYLKNIFKDYKNGVDGIYICIHDSSRFFFLLQKLIEVYSNDFDRKLLDPSSIIRSIWLRMGSSDISNVEKFLERQILFIKNYKVLLEYRELFYFDNNDILAYNIRENDDFFETNKNIVFSIRRSSNDYLEGTKDYEFPAIHFGISKENGEAISYIYGIQSISYIKDSEIKDSLQLTRKNLRNKYVSSDFIISLGLFLDYLYDIGIEKVEVPVLQVFNYPYHEILSSNISDSFNSYTDSDRKEIEFLYENGNRSDRVEDYMHIKKMVSRFVNKQDSISYNKTERLIYTFYELINRYNSVELISDAYGQSDNMIIKLNGKTNILNNYQKKEDYYKI
jgi:hypothetical protein